MDLEKLFICQTFNSNKLCNFASVAICKSDGVQQSFAARLTHVGTDSGSAGCGYSQINLPYKEDETRCLLELTYWRTKSSGIRPDC